MASRINEAAGGGYSDRGLEAAPASMMFCTGMAASSYRGMVGSSAQSRQSQGVNSSSLPRSLPGVLHVTSNPPLSLLTKRHHHFWTPFCIGDFTLFSLPFPLQIVTNSHRRALLVPSLAAIVDRTKVLLGRGVRRGTDPSLISTLGI